MQEPIQLTGLGVYSPRLHFLRKLALRGNPLTSELASGLLVDKTARRVGGWLEFLILVVMPLYFLTDHFVTIGWYNDFMLQHKNFNHPLNTTQTSEAQLLITVLTISALLSFAAVWVTGLFTALMPGIRLKKLINDGKFKEPGDIDKTILGSSLFTVQTASVAMPFLVYIIIFIIFKIIQEGEPAYTQSPSTDVYNQVTGHPATQFLFNLIYAYILSYAGIWAGMKFRSTGFSALGLIGFMICFFLIFTVPVIHYITLSMTGVRILDTERIILSVVLVAAPFFGLLYVNALAKNTVLAKMSAE